MISAVICVLFCWDWHLYNLPYASAYFYCKICFSVSKYLLLRDKIWCLPWTCSLLAFCILRRRARLWLELFARTEGRFLSQVSYLPSYIFLRRCCSFTSRELCIRLSKEILNIFFSHYVIELMFLELDVYVYSSFDCSCITGFKCNSLRASLLTVLRVVYAAPLFGFVLWLASKNHKKCGRREFYSWLCSAARPLTNPTS